jgi:hypothetical protein
MNHFGCGLPMLYNNRNHVGLLHFLRYEIKKMINDKVELVGNNGFCSISSILSNFDRNLLLVLTYFLFCI